MQGKYRKMFDVVNNPYENFYVFNFYCLTAQWNFITIEIFANYSATKLLSDHCTGLCYVAKHKQFSIFVKQYLSIANIDITAHLHTGIIKISKSSKSSKFM